MSCQPRQWLLDFEGKVPYVRVTRRYGGGHYGIDYAGDAGGGIPAALAGVVAVVGAHRDYGNLIALGHELPHGGYLLTVYGHLVEPSSLAAGAAVEQYGIIGKMGSTGRATGPHLHFETRASKVLPTTVSELMAISRSDPDCTDWPSKEDAAKACWVPCKDFRRYGYCDRLTRDAACWQHSVG